MRIKQTMPICSKKTQEWIHCWQRSSTIYWWRYFNRNSTHPCRYWPLGFMETQ